MRRHSLLHLALTFAIVLPVVIPPTPPLQLPPTQSSNSTAAAVTTNADQDVHVLTRNYTNDRLGTNNKETILTTSNVVSATFGKLFSIKIDNNNLAERPTGFDCPSDTPNDPARVTPMIPLTQAKCTEISAKPGQVYAQPLYVANLDVAGKGKRNVVFVATQRNNLYAFDADDPSETTPLWHRQLGAYGVSALGEFGFRYGPQFTDINPYVGIISTPVIDLATFTIYLVSFNRVVNGNTRTFEHRLHAIDIRTGLTKDLGANPNPRVIQGFVNGSGADGLPDYNGNVNNNLTDGNANRVTFESRQHLQRPALLLDNNGILYLAFSGYAGTNPYHGWLMAYQASNLQQQAIFNTTPTSGSSTKNVDAGQGGIWMSGHGPALDEEGNVLVVSANGTADVNNLGQYPGTKRNLADSAIKLKLESSPTPTFTLKSFFTPNNREFLRINDQDLGVSGITLLPPDVTGPTGQKLAVTGSKEGRLFFLNRSTGDNLGSYTNDATPGDCNEPANENYVERIQVAPPRISTCNPTPNPPPNGINFIGRHIHGLPAYYNVPNGAAAGHNLYVMAEADFLKQYRQDPTTKKFGPSPIYTSTVAAPEKTAGDLTRGNGPQSIPGGTIAVTSNNGLANSGIVWVYHQLCGDANIDPKPGILRAFDAADIRNELWNSEQVVLSNGIPLCPAESDPPAPATTPITPGYASRDGGWYFSKFTQPAIVNGKAYVPTFSGEVVVYGLLNALHVTKSVDDGTVGTFSQAVKKAPTGYTIYFDRFRVNDVVTTTVNMTGTLALNAGVNIKGSDCGQPPVVINGSDAPPNTVGLTVASNSLISGLHITSFPGGQTKVLGGGNVFKCFKATKNLAT